MLKFSHTSLIRFSGLIWLAAGMYLLQLGINLLLQIVANPDSFYHPLLKSLSGYTGGIDNAVVLLTAFSLLIGLLKSKTIFSKTVTRIVNRIRSLPDPAPLAKAYSPGYIALILSMMMIGILIKVFQVPNDIRGMIDATIGSALINGAMLYFRAAIKPATCGN